ISALMMPSYLPDFKIDDQLLFLMTEEMLLKNPEPLAFSTGIIFLGNVTASSELITNIKKDQFIMHIYEAEGSFLPLDGTWEQIQESSASNGYVITCEGNGSILNKITIPRNDSYIVSIRGYADGGITVKLDETLKTIKTKNDGELTWYETGPFYLTQGTHQLIITYKGNSTTVDQVVLSSANIAKTLSGSEIRVKRASLTKYEIEVKSEEPVYIFLGEAFHPQWNAHVDKKKLMHFTAFYWANAFFLNKTGEIQVKITFNQQPTRNLITTTWSVSWGLLLSALIYVYRIELKRQIIRLSQQLECCQRKA
ncbi:MAG: hypothetical protein ACTSYO_00380, partial [Candidatus Ranarchaeia archaeon]